jgi:hypothetical protein
MVFLSSHDLVDGRFETNNPTQNLAQDAIAAFARLILECR